MKHKPLGKKNYKNMVMFNYAQCQLFSLKSNNARVAKDKFSL
jgi:hypothetical protein